MTFNYFFDHPIPGRIQMPEDLESRSLIPIPENFKELSLEQRGEYLTQFIHDSYRTNLDNYGEGVVKFQFNTQGFDINDFLRGFSAIRSINNRLDILVYGDLGDNTFRGSNSIDARAIGNVGDNFGSGAWDISAKIDGNAGDGFGKNSRQCSFHLNGRAGNNPFYGVDDGTIIFKHERDAHKALGSPSPDLNIVYEISPGKGYSLTYGQIVELSIKN